MFDRCSLDFHVSGACIFLYRWNPVGSQVEGQVEKTSQRFCVAKV